MSKYKITTDYTCDLSEDFWRENPTERVIMPYSICGKEYYTDEDMDYKMYYKLLKEGNMATTSQVVQYDAEERFSKIMEKGYDIIHLGLSGGVSSSHENFTPTVNSLKEKFPDRKITIVNTLNGSGGLGIMVYEANKNMKNGMSYDDNVKYLESIVPNVYPLFVVDDLIHLKRGGRLSLVEATLGTLLGIKPLLALDKNGKICVEAKARGTKKAHIAMVEKTLETIIPEDNDFIIITHADNIEGAEKLGNLIKEKINVDIMYAPLTKVVGSHVGKDTLAIFYKGKARF